MRSSRWSDSIPNASCSLRPKRSPGVSDQVRIGLLCSRIRVEEKLLRDVGAVCVADGRVQRPLFSALSGAGTWVR